MELPKIKIKTDSTSWLNHSRNNTNSAFPKIDKALLDAGSSSVDLEGLFPVSVKDVFNIACGDALNAKDLATASDLTGIKLLPTTLRKRLSGDIVILPEANKQYDNPKYEFGLMTKQEFLDFRNPAREYASLSTLALDNDIVVPSTAKLVKQFKVDDEVLKLYNDEDIDLYITNPSHTVVGYVEGTTDNTATTIKVAREYHGFGIGQILGNYWYKISNARSGGFTRSGEKNAIRTWEARVREFLSSGWYTDLVRDKKISPQRVREILAGLGPRKSMTRKTIYSHFEKTAHGYVTYVFTIDAEFPTVHAASVFEKPDDTGTEVEFLSRNHRYNKTLIIETMRNIENMGGVMAIYSIEDSIYKLDDTGQVHVDGDTAILKNPTSTASEYPNISKIIEHLQKQSLSLGGMGDTIL